MLKKLCLVLALLLPISSYGAPISEYGIVLIPSKECTNKAIELNEIIAHRLAGLENPHNNWHVTLYHGAFEQKDLSAIYNKLRSLNVKNVLLKFSKIYPTSDRWIDWGVQKNSELQALHEAVVRIASPYHKRPLKRSADIYDSLDSEKKHQVDEYGVSGILQYYNPHMTLFYQYPPSPTLQNIKLDQVLRVCHAHIAVGELGYNGNIVKILHMLP